MLNLPEFAKAWDYENGFYLTCDPSRLAKLLAHYELFQQIVDVPGAIVECGVFKGASLARFAMLRALFGGPHSRPIIGFDTFGPFPETDFAADRPVRQRFIEAAGGVSISAEQLREVLARKGCDQSIELVAGDICRTVPDYVERHPELRIALLNLDTDLYEPAVVILRHLYPHIVPGGILILDDYGVFPGETQAVDEYLRGQEARIRKLPFSNSPAFLVKG